MKTIQMYEQGDVVKVVNEGKRYDTYEDMFRVYGMDKPTFYTPNKLGFKELKEGYLYTVVSQVPHLHDLQDQLVFIKDKSGYVYLIRVDGVELYQPQVISWA